MEAPFVDASPKDEAGAARVLQKRARGMQTRREIAKRKEAGELPGQARLMLRVDSKATAAANAPAMGFMGNLAASAAAAAAAVVAAADSEVAAANALVVSEGVLGDGGEGEGAGGRGSLR